MKSSLHLIDPSSITGSADEPTVVPEWQLRFVLHKLGLKKGERILLLGEPCANTIAMTSALVGQQGKVTLLCEGDAETQALSLQRWKVALERHPALEVLPAGPQLETSDYQAVIVLSNRAHEPFPLLLQQAWRYLQQSGRVLLLLSKSESQSNGLVRVVDAAQGTGFVTRYRRNCDVHCAWVGVKYEKPNRSW